MAVCEPDAQLEALGLLALDNVTDLTVGITDGKPETDREPVEDKQSDGLADDD